MLKKEISYMDVVFVFIDNLQILATYYEQLGYNGAIHQFNYGKYFYNEKFQVKRAIFNLSENQKKEAIKELNYKLKWFCKILQNEAKTQSGVFTIYNYSIDGENIAIKVKNRNIFSDVADFLNAMIKKYQLPELTKPEIKEHQPGNNKSDKVKKAAKYWIYIFYYLKYSKCLPEENDIVKEVMSFINDNKLDIKTNYFRNTYYDIKKRIYNENEYSETQKMNTVKKIEEILPYLKKYPNALKCAKNDIDILKEEIKHNE